MAKQNKNWQSYSEKLQDPRWQKKKTEILIRDNFTCTRCNGTDVTLHVHHLEYIRGRDPWDYDNSKLALLCSICHKITHEKIKPLEKERYEEMKLIYEHTTSFLTATQTHIDMLMHSLSKGVPEEVEQEILKNIMYLQEKRREYKNG